MNVLEFFKPITTFVFDIDGVLTDGTILVLDNGLQARKMNIKDGYALQLAVKKGYHVLIISGGHSPQVLDRLKKLGVTEVYMNILDKKDQLLQYMQKNNLQKDQVLFMGDDIPDLAVMKSVGLPCCPNDAVQEIKDVAVYISPLNGGYGCARDVIEKVLKLNDHWGHENEVASR